MFLSLPRFAHRAIVGLVLTMALAPLARAQINSPHSGRPAGRSSRAGMNALSAARSAARGDKYELHLLQFAAHGNDAVAEMYLGFLYLNGEGVKQNYSEAAKWLTKAAEQRQPPAEYELGQLYYDGHGVDQDLGKAVD